MAEKNSTNTSPPTEIWPPGQEPRQASSWIEKTPGVCGGEARIRRTRIPVWLLVEWRREGLPDSQLLDAYPSLTPADLALAWEYYEHNRQEIEEVLVRQQEA
jgi:uncharacterized protein (DUF433 family)